MGNISCLGNRYAEKNSILIKKFNDNQVVITEYMETAANRFQEQWQYPYCETARLEDFEVLRTLGKGSFGRVILVLKKENKNYYAMKVLEKLRIIKSRLVENILNEKRILACLKFPFMVSLVYHFKDNSHLYLVMDYILGGELFAFIQKSKMLPEDSIKFYAVQIALSLEYLHSMEIAHRDLKPENILIAEDGYLKLTDFGFAKKIPGRAWTFCGTPEYIAPEIILCRGYNKSVDWWAFGILIFEMYAGHTPFSDNQPVKVYEKIISGKIKFPPKFPNVLKDLIKHLVEKDLTRRYGNLRDGVLDIKLHKWFSAMDWLAIYRKELKAPYIPEREGPGDVKHFAQYEEKSLVIAPIDHYGDQFDDF